MPQMPRSESYVPNAFVKGCGTQSDSDALWLFNNARITVVLASGLVTGTPRYLWEIAAKFGPLERSVSRMAIIAVVAASNNRTSRRPTLARGPVTSFQMARFRRGLTSIN